MENPFHHVLSSPVISSKSHKIKHNNNNNNSNNTPINNSQTKNQIDDNRQRPSKWRSLIGNRSSIRKGKSLNSLRKDESQLESQNNHSINDDNTNSPYPSIQQRLTKLFRSSSKLNYSVDKAIQAGPTQLVKPSHVINKTKNSPTPIKTVAQLKVMNNDVALRNLSFTAAMMSKEVKNSKNQENNMTNVVVNEFNSHTETIPSSTLRFWSKPSEEKLKASMRRSTEFLQQIQSSANNKDQINQKEISSMLSLFGNSDINDSCANSAKPINLNTVGTGNVVVPGYDRALSRYLTIISNGNNSSKTGRKERIHSLAYEQTDENIIGDSNCPNQQSGMRECRSHGQVNTLGITIKSINSPKSHNAGINDNVNSDSHHELENSSRPKSQYKNQYHKRQYPPPPPNYWCSKSPPSYQQSAVGSSSSSAIKRQSRSCNRLNRASYENSATTPPVPPPRSDSLIRSFNLICNNLTTSITSPREDHFKLFKSQSDYQNWLRNLPYHNPSEISSLLRRRSQQARRQCVSELLDDLSRVSTVNPSYAIMDSNGQLEQTGLPLRRCESWPKFPCHINWNDNNTGNISNTNHPSAITEQQFLQSSLNYPSKRSSSLLNSSSSKQRAYLFIPKELSTKDSSNPIDSPSLQNYSKLYCLKKANNLLQHHQLTPSSSATPQFHRKTFVANHDQVLTASANYMENSHDYIPSTSSNYSYLTSSYQQTHQQLNKITNNANV